MKKCSKCNIERDCSEFHKKACSKDGYRSLCKRCRAARKTISNCRACSISKENASFVKGKNLCKRCDSLRGVKKRFEKSCSDLNIYFEPFDYLAYKICKSCDVKKEIPLFTTFSSSYCYICSIDSRKSSQKKFYENNTCAYILYRKKDYINNKEKYLLRGKRYRDLNKHKELERSRRYRAARKAEGYQKPIAHKLRHRISCCIRKAIKKNGNSMTKYLSYTMQDLKKHLELQFDDWMTWENWGVYSSKTWDDNDSSTWVWNIDHIKPQSEFIFTSMEDDNFKKCWALSNLRPYSAKQNVIDGCNRIRHGGL